MNDLHIDKAFKYMHQTVFTKIKNFGIKYWIVKTIAEPSIYVYKGNPSVV